MSTLKSVLLTTLTHYVKFLKLFYWVELIKVDDKKFATV